jgi:hypothetical protein
MYFLQLYAQPWSGSVKPSWAVPPGRAQLWLLISTHFARRERAHSYSTAIVIGSPHFLNDEDVPLESWRPWPVLALHQDHVLLLSMC